MPLIPAAREQMMALRAPTVAATRARDHLTVTGTGAASPFLAPE